MTSSPAPAQYSRADNMVNVIGISREYGYIKIPDSDRKSVV